MRGRTMPGTGPAEDGQVYEDGGTAGDSAVDEAATFSSTVQGHDRVGGGVYTTEVETRRRPAVLELACSAFPAALGGVSLPK